MGLCADGAVVEWGGDGAVTGALGRDGPGSVAQPPNKPPKISAPNKAPFGAIRSRIMWLLILEALGALAVFVLIVWWTMFSGRKKGELRSDSQDH